MQYLISQEAKLENVRPFAGQIGKSLNDMINRTPLTIYTWHMPNSRAKLTADQIPADLNCEYESVLSHLQYG